MYISEVVKNIYFAARWKLLKVRCIVTVHTKSPLRSIEDRERNEKGSGADGHRSYEFLCEKPGGSGKRRGIANASGGGRARLSRAKNAGEKRERERGE